MSSLWLKATDKQIGVAFSRSIGQAQEFARRFDRTDPADNLVLAGFGTLLNLMHMQLEYTLERRKRDPDALLKAFAEEIEGYRNQIQEVTVPVKDVEVQTKLAELGIEPEHPEPETETIPGTLALCIRLRSLAIPATHNGLNAGVITYPVTERQRVKKQAKHWKPYPGEVRDLGRMLCGLPDDADGAA